MRKHPFNRALLAGALSLALANAFAAAPSVATIHTIAAATVADASEESSAAFWQRFDDPLLTQLVEDALAHNHDLRIAVAHLDQADAALGLDRAERWPTVTASGESRDQRASADQAPGVHRADRDGRAHSLSALLSWELDLFGRVRHRVAAGRAQRDAAVQDLQALQIAIVGEVAQDYWTLRGLQQQLRVATEHAQSQADTARMIEAGVEAGRGTEFDAARTRAQLATTQAHVPALQAAIAATRHRLAVLTGAQPKALDDALAGNADLPAMPAPLDAGTPGDLLRRRPDIAAAEARLRAANARIDVAEAGRFPVFTLGGLIGTQGTHRDALFERDSESRVIALGVDWSFLDRGRVRSRTRGAEAEAAAAGAGYEQTVLRALEETETALVGYALAREEDLALSRAAADGATAAKLARVRFEAGASSLFEVLDAERTHLQAQDAATQARTRSFTRLIGVYRALAGGWPSRVDTNTPAPSGVPVAAN